MAERRKEDHRLLTGRGRFVSDLALPRLRHLAFLRSEMAHARLSGVDVSAVSALDPQARVFTASSPGFGVGLRAQSALAGYVETEQPVLARHRVRYVGEPIAAVVAEDRYRAEDAAERVVVHQLREAW